MNYWKRQHTLDVCASVLFALVAVGGPKAGIPVLVNITADTLSLSARAWVGPALTLLGMMSATTAFIFSVVDRSEFAALKALGVESQLWSIFAQNILWLAVAALCAMVLAFLPAGSLPDALLGLVVFLFSIISICLIKFAWVMRQIIFVRASR